uniref:Small ribosomal subunit protein mS26 n=1 Tax=Panagrolaimus superbus TaxID=310955 RepID=A0A914XUS7_9BILA
MFLNRCFLSPASSNSSCLNAVSLPLFISSRNIGRRTPKPGKPPILPPAKKVLYKVVHPPWMKPEDVKELLWRRHAYNNAVVSLRKVFKREIEAKEAAGLGIEALRVREKDELNELILENERRNQEATLKRERQEKEEYEKIKAEFLGEIGKKLSAEAENAKEKTIEVKKMIEISQTFVTKDNLDDKLKEALEKPVVFDYCIDLNGNKFFDPVPMKYVEGTPTRQKARVFDRSLVQPRNTETPPPQPASATSM